MFTHRTLRSRGYTGKIFIVLDDEDETIEAYREVYGDDILVFCKADIAETFDEADNTGDRKSIVYARNACFELARQQGYRYFMQADDDYTTFAYRFDQELRYGWFGIYDVDSLFENLLTYYESVPSLLSLCISQGGDHVGGGSGSFGKVISARRKAMNTFICSTERPFQFFGRINEDVNVYTTLGRRGALFLTITSAQIVQNQTQQTEGGMTDIYRINGTYVKSFYSILYSPSCVSIGWIGQKHKRLHHRVDWKATAPKIIREEWRAS